MVRSPPLRRALPAPTPCIPGRYQVRPPPSLLLPPYQSACLRPANILLTSTLTPVLVEFGFAERSSSHSALSYGTPEYLSPERVKGLAQNTRPSDIWSLGIALFEILVGRTPFERDGEVFETTTDSEVYWVGSKHGEWLRAGEWNGG